LICKVAAIDLLQSYNINRKTNMIAARLIPSQAYEELMICGQSFMRVGKCIRGPLKVVGKLAGNGWSNRSRILAHICNDGSVWHEAEFQTIAEARAAFNKLKAKRGAISVGEYIRRCRGESAG
jgi:hypothetical protein